MQEVSKSKAIKLVESFQDTHQTWHYHLLIPGCQFNTSTKSLILIENLYSNQSYIVISDAAAMELSNKLATMLHGKDAMDKANTKTGYKPTEEMAAILILIADLSAQKMIWHHHVLFPGCKFNNHSEKYELCVEDPRNSTRLSSISQSEPIENLKQIESAFYAQKL